MTEVSVQQAMQLAMSRYRTRQLAEAESICRHILAAQPDHAEALHLLGVLASHAGRNDLAADLVRKATAAAPYNPVFHYHLGKFLQSSGQFDQAISSYQNAVALNPEFVEALTNLAVVLNEKGRLDESIACCRRALAGNPESVEAHNNLGNTQKESGQIDDAIACYRRAMELDPDYLMAHDNLLYTLPFHPDSDPASLLVEFQRWNRQHAQPLKRFIRPHSNDRTPDRRLRIGYVSPDFRRHPVGRFLVPLMASHDHTAHEVFCYSGVIAPDPLTATIKSHADVWRNIVGLSDEQAVEMIRQDRIDILVDLSMHMGGNRLPIFARKPAPVQVTYLAYAGGTALNTIDYRLTDRFLDPDEAGDRYYMEKSIRLPQTYWCYGQSIETEPANELPMLTTGKITLGCLNSFSKVSAAALETWAKLLNSLRDSRLVLHIKSGSPRDRVIQFMSDRGITGDRLDIVGYVSSEEYFKTYHGIDIALDPFPYAGGTTTCDALWMGVPVVTLAGKIGVARAGVSILSNVGLPGLIAQTTGEYVRIAADLAADRPRLAELRATLRQRMQNSPLMDADRFARDVESAYRTMWRAWCNA